LRSFLTFCWAGNSAKTSFCFCVCSEGERTGWYFVFFLKSLKKVDLPADPSFQYLIFAARPYENIAFKLPSLPIERDMVTYKDKIFFDWDRERKVFSLQILFQSQTVAE
jgi:hypothetical protein